MRLELPTLHNRQFFLRQLCGQRRTQRTQNHLSWQRIFVAARHRAMDRAAVAPERRTDGADSRAARSLLLPKLPARAAYFALVFRLVRSRAPASQMVPHRLVQKVLVDLGREHIVGQIDRADFLAFKIFYVHNGHGRLSVLSLPGRLGLANFNIAAGWPRHCATHEQQIFVSINLDHAQALRRFAFISHVPGKMLALPHARRKRTGADAAGRAMEHRTVASVAAAIVPALHAALKSFALADAAYIHVLANFESVDQDAVARLRFVLRILELHFTEIAHRRDARLLEVARQGLGHALRLDEFDQAKLHGVVAVLVLRPALHNYARAGL